MDNVISLVNFKFDTYKFHIISKMIKYETNKKINVIQIWKTLLGYYILKVDFSLRVLNIEQNIKSMGTEAVQANSLKSL